jgi:hypothetical protein
MTTAIQKQNPTVTNFALSWFLGTAVLGLLTTLTSAHSMFAYWMLLLTGLLTGLVQWYLLRPYMGRAWRWVALSTGGWILGLLLKVGVLFALLIFIGRMDNLLPAFSLGLVKTIEVFVCTALFGIMGTVQAIPLRQALPMRANLWVLWSAVGGTLLGLLMQITCTIGGGDLLTSQLLLEAVADNRAPFCVNIGLTIPRLQTIEPLFYVIPLSWAAHALGWAAYAGTTAFAMRRLLRQSVD